MFAGELIFLRDGSEVFRLAGVPRPDTFREVCLKARMARITIGAVLKRRNGGGVVGKRLVIDS